MEVRRGLDWVNDDEKILLDVSSHSNIADAVIGVHDSQICGGKRYDLATEGRRIANTNGGIIYIGVQDSGEIVGLDNADFVMQQISNLLS